jgi:hypothetical protein
LEIEKLLSYAKIVWQALSSRLLRQEVFMMQAAKHNLFTTRKPLAVGVGGHSPETIW